MELTDASNQCRKVCGVGTNVNKLPIRVDGELTKAYNAWVAMIQRCYSAKKQARHPTYMGCSVCSEWLDYSNFKTWHDKFYVEGYDLDKDIVVAGNKCYSPTACNYVPERINTLLITKAAKRNLPVGVSYFKRDDKYQAYVSIKGKKKNLGYFETVEEASAMYVKAKEAHVKVTATEAFNDGEINETVFKALMEWRVNNGPTDRASS